MKIFRKNNVTGGLSAVFAVKLPELGLHRDDKFAELGIPSAWPSMDEKFRNAHGYGSPMKLRSRFFAATLVLASSATAADKLKALIVDGQNNHAVWPKSTIMMKEYLQNSGLFEVDVARTKFISNHKREAAWLPLAGAGTSEGTEKPVPDPGFAPDFTKYAIVVSNFGFGAADKSSSRGFRKMP